MGETLLSEDTYIKHSGIRDEVCEAENVIKKTTTKKLDMTLIMSLCKSYMDPHLSRAALLLSTNSTDDGSSIPTFTLVIPVEPNDTCHTAGREKKKVQNQRKKQMPGTHLQHFSLVVVE